MRKIEREMNRASIKEVNWKKDNTEVVVSDAVLLIKLHGNIIAKLDRVTREFSIRSAGLATRTTASRLNSLVGRFYRVNLKDGKLILSKIDKQNNVIRSFVLPSVNFLPLEHLD